MMVEAMGLRMGPVWQVSHVNFWKCVIAGNPIVSGHSPIAIWPGL